MKYNQPNRRRSQCHRDSPHHRHREDDETAHIKVKNLVTFPPMAAAPLAIMKLAIALSNHRKKQPMQSILIITGTVNRVNEVDYIPTGVYNVSCNRQYSRIFREN